MIRLAIDLQACQTKASGKRGIGRYSLALARAIAGLRSTDLDLRLVLNGLYQKEQRAVLDAFQGLVPATHFSSYTYPVAENGSDEHKNTARNLAGRLIRWHYAQLSPDILHISSLFEGVGEAAATVSGLPQIPARIRSATLYDLIPLIYKDVYLATPEAARWYHEKLAALRLCDMVLAISESSRQDAISRLGFNPSQVVNISGAADSHFVRQEITPEAETAFRRRFGLKESFVLYTGGIDFRKNLEGALKAFARLPGIQLVRHQLVIVCHADQNARAHLMEQATRFGLLPDSLVITGYVSDADMVTFYNLCTVFLFPSLYEGFGLPVLEAMACGAPVLAADNSSLPEIVDRRDSLFDARRPDAIAETLHKALTDADWRAELARSGLERAKSFSWERTGRLALEALTEAHHRRQAVPSLVTVPALPRRRLACFTPWPPERSGIADYSAELLPALARWFAVDLYVGRPPSPETMAAPGLTIRHWSDFPARSGDYEIIVYHFGNSEFHWHMVDLIQRYPGVVVLHDFYLSGMIHYMEHALGRPNALAQESRYAHGPALPLALLEEDGIGRVIRDFPCNRRVLDHAIGVIVHSPYHFELCRRFYPSGLRTRLHMIRQMRATVPAASTSERARVRAMLDLDSDDIVVCSFGFLVFTKLNERLVAAVTEAREHPQSRLVLVFVGELDGGDYGRRLQEQIEASPARESIRITGFVDAERYRDWLMAADIAVQLRTMSRGETSRAVLDCLAWGLPTIVNAHGTLNDYPETAVVRISEEAPVSTLRQALETLAGDAGARARLAENGRTLIAVDHSLERIAAEHAAALEAFFQQEQARDIGRLAADCATVLADGVGTEDDLVALEQAVPASTPSFAPPRLLIDVSYIAKIDHQSGIQRVVRSLCRSFYQRTDSPYRPVAVTLEKDGLCVAQDFRTGLFGPAAEVGVDTKDRTVNVFHPGDVLLMLDSSWASYGEWSETFRAIRSRGGRIVTVVYDLIPVLHPEFSDAEMTALFSSWLRNAVAESDALLCISRTVADQVMTHIDTEKLPHARPLRIGWFHLGADIPLPADAEPEDSVRSELQEVFANKAGPVFLMVGTLEPRKGHGFALDTFERLWQEGAPVTLCLLGKEGWNVKTLVERLRTHAEVGRRLVWIEHPNDAEVSWAYRSADALLFPSQAEGFGLPIIEAAQHSLPVLCSDIPVFREVAGDSAHYFALDRIEPLCDAVRAWPAHRGRGTGIEWKTWAEAAARIEWILTEDRWYEKRDAHE